MKIDKSTEKPVPSTVNTASSATKASDASKAQAAPPAVTTAIPSTADPSAKIALSSEATSLISSDNAGEFDAEKVARVSQALNDGTYKVNPEAIADKLISNAQELLKPPT
jgi:negative regulator of flagellin synthesis FlgM